MAPSASYMSRQMRKYQEAHPELGPFYTAVHTFIDRTLRQFFKQDADLMPHPVVAFERILSTRLAEYHPMDGYTLTDKIIVDPFKFKNGLEITDVIAHELVHVWEHYLGYPFDGTHGQQFHDKMMDYGIATQGNTAEHVGTVGDVWSDWLAENEDLHLGNFTLGAIEGMRSMQAYECRDCGATVFSYSRNLKIVCARRECWGEMEKT